MTECKRVQEILDRLNPGEGAEIRRGVSVSEKCKLHPDSPHFNFME